MKKLFGMMVGLLATAFIYAQKVNDPNAEARTVKAFHAISVSSSFDVYLSQGNEDAVAVSAKENRFREDIIVEVKDGTLHVSYRKGLQLNMGNKDLKVYISFKSLNKISISGSCNVYIAGKLKADDLMINLSGSSDMKGTIDAKKMGVDLSGASDLSLTGGTAAELNIEASGASKFKGFDFAADICNLEASGASDIKITVNKELSARASGASDIQYKGSGVITDIKTSGSSSVSKSGS